MAKRKRLTPARITEEAPLETKSAYPSFPNGVAQARTIRPPIADVAQDASASAALSEIAQTLSDARAEGRLIQRLPLDTIDAEYLVRDRIAYDADDMTALMQSLQSRGQQTPIEVTALADGRYGLISGWRRFLALRMLSENAPDTLSDAGTILAIVRTPQDAAAAYQAMIEENEIRVGLSFFERARIVARAVDAGVFNRDRVALAKLFSSVSRPKRSKIGSFLKIVRALEDALHFPTQLTERNGLALAQALDADPHAAARVRAALAAKTPRDATAEASIIAAAMTAPQDLPADPPAAALPPLRPGLRLKETAKGEIVLGGPALQDPAFRAALLAFLAE